jgi:hypothetical protein
MPQILDSDEPTPSLAERILKLLHCSQQGLGSEGFIFIVCSNGATRNMLKLSDVLSICCNLVVYDEELDQFQFAHLSVREYLDGREGCPSREINALAAEQCLRYLLLSNDNKLENFGPENSSQVHGKLSFRDHADASWARYSQLSGILRKEMPLKSLLHTFLLSSPGPLFGSAEFEEWENRLRIKQESSYLHHLDLLRKIYKGCLCFPSNPLFVASAFDFSEMIATLLHDVSSLFEIP